MLNKRELETMMELVAEVDKLKPLADDLTYTLTRVFGPNFKDLIRTMSMAMVDITVDMVEEFEKRDFSRKDAILLTVNTKVALTEALRSSNKTLDDINAS